jgi:transcriptional regulator with XRE-family HTH domain
MSENIIKRTCKELGLTYKQLGEAIGYKPDTVNKAVSTGKVSDPMQRAIELYLENLELKKQLKDYNQLKELLRKAVI